MTTKRKRLTQDDMDAESMEMELAELAERDAKVEAMGGSELGLALRAAVRILFAKGVYEAASETVEWHNNFPMIEPALRKLETIEDGWGFSPSRGD